MLGVPPRGHVASAVVDLDRYWNDLVAGFEQHAAPLAILVDDATFADPDSRDFLLSLSERLRFRPVLLVLSLDESHPSFPAWQERLVARPEVDWLRLPTRTLDARERAELREKFEALPASGQRVVGFAALIGGSASEVLLGRVVRLGWSQLAEALVPATESGLLRVGDGKIAFARDGWAEEIGEQLAPLERSEMHREIADALAP